MNKPLVSIIMTTYNPVEEYFKIAIESIVRQTHTAWELIIVDDGSDKDLYAIIDSFGDDRIIYKRCDVNRGISACANDAIAMAKGDFLAKMDDDDIAREYWLEKMLQYFNANREVNVLGCAVELTGTKEGVINPKIAGSREKQQADLLLQNAAFPHPFFMVRKEFWDQTNMAYNTKYRSSVDYALWVEMIRYTKFHVYAEIMGIYRRHMKQISTKTYSQQQNFADEVRWSQLRRIGIEPSEEQKLLHNKLCKIAELETDELRKMDAWVALMKCKNKEAHYFDIKALKNTLHQRAATLYLRYFGKTHDVRGIMYFVRYATVQNLCNGVNKIFSR